MFDGSTIRQKFSSSDTIRTSVRPWVDKQRLDGDEPYTFKQILSPLPNRTIGVAEEDQNLKDLGLHPSATLVMVPVSKYQIAYSADQGLLNRALSVGYGVASAGYNMAVSIVTPILRSGNAGSQTNEALGHNRSQARNANGNHVRTIQHQREENQAKQDHQLYNGNQVGGASTLFLL